MSCASDQGKQVCTKHKAAGADCQTFDSVPCSKGNVCLEKKCAAAKKAGDTCTPPVIAFLPGECALGLACVGEAGKQVCTTKAMVGGACTSDGGCRGIDTTCTDGKCAVVAIVGVGGTCVPKSKHKLMLISFGCQAGLTCDTDICAAICG